MNNSPPIPPPTLPVTQRRNGRLGLWISLAALLLVLGAGIAVTLFRARVGLYSMTSESMLPTLHPCNQVLVDKTAYANGILPTRGDTVVYNAPERATGGHKNIQMIHRIVALPGDTVTVQAAKLLVGGQNPDVNDEFFSAHDFIRARLHLDEDTVIRFENDQIRVDGKSLTTAQLATQLGTPGKSVKIIPGQVLVNNIPIAEPYTREDPAYKFPVDRAAALVPPGHVFLLGDNRNRAADSHLWGTLPISAIVGRATKINP